jgi:hypothetical protein
MHDRRAPRDRPARDASAFVPVTVAGRGTNLLPAIVVATGLAFVLAFVKPWGDGVAGPTPLVQAPATPTPVGGLTVVPDESAAEIGRMCVGTSAWLVASEERISGQPVRIWRSVVPAESILRPDDPAIPWVPITSGSVSALGWCGPELPQERLVDPTLVEAWAVSDAGLRTLALLRLRPSGPMSSLGGLYRPAFAPAAISPSAAWPAGRYLFRVRSGDGRVFTFGVEVEILPPARSPGVTWRARSGASA